MKVSPSRHVVVLIAAAVCVACSAGAGTSPAGTAPGPSGSAVLATAATSQAADASVIDPAAGLRIAPPYTLMAADPGLASVVQGMRDQAGFEAGARTVEKDGTVVGYVLVVGLGGDTDADFRNAIEGFGASSGAPLQASTIAGTPVWSSSTDALSTVLFRAGDTAVVVETKGRSGEIASAIAAALISANP